MNNFETIIGIEIHIELKTQTKMFSPAKVDFNAVPNTNANQIDLGYPGTLPLVNKQAVKFALAFAKALNMEIDDELHFDRKNYFYPDLPKGFQITQFFRPIGKNGKISIKTSEGLKDVLIERIHLEEDTAKQIHDQDGTKLDYNRAGTPLIEIVTYPVLKNGEEAAAYIDMIKKTVNSLEISDGKLEEGSLRADINISLRPYGSNLFGTKVEIKNMNSLSNVKKAIDFEIKLQTQKLLQNEEILQQTKRFDDQSNTNIVMRTKTGTTDYKYFPEPNIPFIKLSQDFINSVKVAELPLEKEKRYLSENIQNIYVKSLVDDIELAKYFDAIPYEDKDKLSKVFFAEIVSLANSKEIHPTKLNIKAEHIAQSLKLLDQQIISGKSLKRLIPLLCDFNDVSLDSLLDQHKLKQISDPQQIQDLLSEIIENNTSIVNEYKERPERVLKFVLGNLMKITGGQVNPTLSDKIAKEMLDEKFNN
ncbi:Aspartyl/glutamyl-tRNA(Asn/Gln) amidotransferase subunit B [Mycoplasmopsis citelli]|uniref:Aspartyl/glutamyl-tRNA(Asn/Gln) amidotransferase subunit B n=1 Tax=Mycoplasmopsis citelli TaxID=171281 RepID=A0A449B214_9BACT|nr:Asp-tRNA(Asn)/Glu-tRNA(Gln) amidotransferase subunit GatB [Mycoplasmopsis citelli]VEU74564.1 Aspartyl/glutamyl-tRNA(Asn/Gln) amidotransferase subunit B [Mycoplasmopsis citelli]